MIDITVKTLDSQNHVFSVEEDISVKQFKEKISPTISIPAEQQRLIFRGSVLKDEKKLTEYNVANNVIHVVQRPSNQNSTANDEPRPSTPAGNRDGLLFGDGVGGGRNAIIMGAIGLPTFGIEGDEPSEDGARTPRRSGATIRLLVGNQFLNRASTVLQQLEDDDAVFAAATREQPPSADDSDAARLDLDRGDAEMEIDIDDEDPDPGSIERMISQVVNVSSAAALVAAIRQVNPGAAPVPPTNNNNASSAASTTTEAAGSSLGGSLSGASTQSVGGSTSNNVGSAPPSVTSASSASENSGASPARRPENPRLRELATALQDLLALQERLNPFLRFLKDALRQNRLFTESGETQSTQFLFDTVSNILHLLSHSLHAFSDISCDFNVAPDDRRLTASSSLLVEQSTVVRATIPVALPAMLAQAAVNNNNATAATQGQPGQPTPAVTGNNQQQQHPHDHPPADMPLHGRFSGLSFSLGGQGGRPGLNLAGVPAQAIPISIPIDPNAIPAFGPAGPWRNPNIRTGTAAGQDQPGQAPPSSQQQQQQQQNNARGNNNNPLMGGVLNSQQLAGMLPPGLQNLGALLGMQNANGVQILGGFNGQENFMPDLARANSNASQGQTENNNAIPQASASSNASVPPSGQNANTSNTENNGRPGSIQSLLRNELTRPQFDPLLPCHTHHSSSRNNRSGRPNRPSEFRRFVNIEESDSVLPNGERGGSPEGETVEILLDLFRNSRLVDMLLPLLRDVVLNYLMRGRDSKNEAHVRTCAKGLAKKILPFFEKFLAKAGTRNEDIDISATYTNLLTGLLANLMLKIINYSSADGRIKSDILSGLNDFQMQLIEMLKVCYPNSPNIGLIFINHVVEHCFGGMSIIFKSHVRDKLTEHLKQLETKVDGSSKTASSLIVYKKPPASVSQPSPSVSQPSASSSRVSDVTSSASTPTPKTQPREESTPKAARITDDVDIDEVLQFPPSMSSVPDASQISPQASREDGLRQNMPESVAMSLIRSLPTDWADTVQEDIRRQAEMPAQPSFSPGYQTLFHRKH